MGVGLLFFLLVGAGGWFWWRTSAQPSGQVKGTMQGEKAKEVSPLPKPRDQASVTAESRPDSSKEQGKTVPEPLVQGSKKGVGLPVIEPTSATGQAKPVNREPPQAGRRLPSRAPVREVVPPAEQESAPKPQERPSDSTAERELFRLALLHQQTGDPRAALELYQKLLALNPKNAVALNNMGVILKEMGQLGKAGDHLRKAIDLDPGYDKAHTNLGVVLQLQEQPQEAIESHLRALAINDKSWESAVNLGLIFWSEGDLESAKRFFSKALGVRHEESVLYHLGLISEQQGERLEAIRHYRQALKKGDGLTLDLREKIQIRLRQLLRGNEVKDPALIRR